MKVTYSSNNSGGNWWLSDEDWMALEGAGWDVDWISKKKDSFIARPDSDGRWLGALACSATKEFKSIDEAEEEFSSITNQDVDDLGCECCGRPHEFYGE